MGARTQWLTAPGATGRPVQRWAAIAGWASLLLPLPAVVWRLAMLVGVPTGFAYPDLYRSSAAGVVYVLGLEAVQVAVAIACFGLIRPWGEVVPAWFPGLAKKTIPRIIPTVLGAVGAASLAAILGILLLTFARVRSGELEGWVPTDRMSGAERFVLYLAYVPFFVWPVAIAVAVVGYWLRRGYFAEDRHRPVQ